MHGPNRQCNASSRAKHQTGATTRYIYAAPSLFLLIDQPLVYNLLVASLLAAHQQACIVTTCICKSQSTSSTGRSVSFSHGGERIISDKVLAHGGCGAGPPAGRCCCRWRAVDELLQQEVPERAEHRAAGDGVGRGGGEAHGRLHPPHVLPRLLRQCGGRQH